jgi:hypothetical protein
VGIGSWMRFYNNERKHQALGYRTPAEIYEAKLSCGYVHDARALHTSPQAQQQPERDSVFEEDVIGRAIGRLAA